MADGQVTQGSEIVKPNVRKVRRINDDVIGGFAGRIACCCRSNMLLNLGSGAQHRQGCCCPQVPRRTHLHCSRGWS